jgi:hypothetical protein
MYIKMYNTVDMKYGYNKRYGGASGKPNSETIKKISEATKGENNPMYGKTHTEENRKLFRDINLGDNSTVARKVICITTGRMFDNITLAMETYKCDHITKCCRGKQKTAGKITLEDGRKVGLQWMYLEDYEKDKS